MVLHVLIVDLNSVRLNHISCQQSRSHPSRHKMSLTLNFCSMAFDWLGDAVGRVPGGPWRLTEPCDVTIGGATWLDQAQETAARTNQNAGPHRRKAGQQRAAPVSQG